MRHRHTLYLSDATTHKLNATAEAHRVSKSAILERARPVDDEMWSVRTITAKTGLARSTIYAYVKQGLFPRQRRLGPGRVGWRASEVRAWMATLQS